MLDVHSATARKRDLRRTMRRAHLSHLRHVAGIAERDLPELWQKFRIEAGNHPLPDVPDGDTQHGRGG
jgi:hypothetical protein